MKLNSILEAVAKKFADVKTGGKKGDPQFAELDRGVLTVGLLLAALDGTVLPAEYAVFLSLAKKCRGGSAKNVRALLDVALPTAGRLMAMAQVSAGSEGASEAPYSETDRLEVFLDAAVKALPNGFANASTADVRRAFVLWTAVGVADGTFSGGEKEAVRQLERFYAAGCAKSQANRASSLFESGFLAKVEKIVRELAEPSTRSRAEAALGELIAGESKPAARVGHPERGRRVLASSGIKSV